MRHLPLLAACAAAALASAPPVHAQVNAIILDMADDGIDLGHEVVTSLVHGTPTRTAWTGPNTDDCFLMLDAGSIRAAGFDIRENGVQQQDLVMFRPGLTIVDAEGQAVSPADGVAMLKLFDSTGDDLITSDDLVFEHLWFFMDMGVDGLVTIDEDKHRPPTVLFAVACTPDGPPVADGTGNLRQAAAWTDERGAHLQQFVDLLELPDATPARATSWGAIKASVLVGGR